MTRTVSILLLLALVFVSSAAAQGRGASPDDADERLRVKDHRNVCVWVEELFARESRTNLTMAALRNRVDVRLRGGGLTPLAYLDNMSTCHRESVASFILAVQVDFVGTNGFVVEAKFMRHVAYFLPDPPRGDDGVRGALGELLSYREKGAHAASAMPILDAVDVALDRFLTEYLKTNASRQPRGPDAVVEET